MEPVDPPIPPGGTSDPSTPRPRRPRYSGTHPKGFAERYKELDPVSYPEMGEHVRVQGRTPAGTHVPVLLDEVLAALTPAPGEIVADCTIGYGGHALAMMERIGAAGRLIGLDVDEAQLRRTGERLTRAVAARSASSPASLPCPFSVHRRHFAGLGKVMRAEGIDGFDILFADLGVSSMQIDDPARGFSYKHDGPLDMRMDDRLVRTASDVVMSWSWVELSAALGDLADEPDHERIARRIVERRAAVPLTRTGQLVQAVFEAKGMTRKTWRAIKAERPGELHPAARTFQALRMIVNDEVGGLEQFLRIAPYCLRPGGRLGVISFHNGEDRRVDEAFREGVRCGSYEVMSGEAVQPSPAERGANPRSRSAMFRWAKRRE